MSRLLVILLVGLGACNTKAHPSPTPAPASTPPPPTVSPSQVPTAAAAACQTLRLLRCIEALPLADGTPCETWVAAQSQTAAGVDPLCLARVKDCTQTAACGR